MTHTWEDLVPWHFECGVRLCDFCNERPEDHDDADRSLCIEAHQIALSVVPCPNSNCMAGEVWAGDDLASCSTCHGATTVPSSAPNRGREVSSENLTQLPDGRWVPAVPLPYVPERRERIVKWLRGLRL